MPNSPTQILPLHTNEIRTPNSSKLIRDHIERCNAIKSRRINLVHLSGWVPISFTPARHCSSCSFGQKLDPFGRILEPLKTRWLVRKLKSSVASATFYCSKSIFVYYGFSFTVLARLFSLLFLVIVQCDRTFCVFTNGIKRGTQCGMKGFVVSKSSGLLRSRPGAWVMWW